jgi:hypothetical protein
MPPTPTPVGLHAHVPSHNQTVLRLSFLFLVLCSLTLNWSRVHKDPSSGVYPPHFNTCSLSFLLYGSPSSHILYFIFTLHLQTGYHPVPLLNYSLFWSHLCIALLASLFLHYAGKLASWYLMPRRLSFCFSLPSSSPGGSLLSLFHFSGVSIPLTGYCTILHKQSPHTYPLYSHTSACLILAKGTSRLSSNVGNKCQQTLRNNCPSWFPNLLLHISD